MKATRFNLTNQQKKKFAKEQARAFFMSDEGFIPIEEAIQEADRKYLRQLNDFL